VEAKRNWTQLIARCNGFTQGLKNDGNVKPGFRNQKAEVWYSADREENGGRILHRMAPAKEKQARDTKATAEGKHQGRARLETPWKQGPWPRALERTSKISSDEPGQSRSREARAATQTAGTRTVERLGKRK
jgi:hypothetical protein